MPWPVFRIVNYRLNQCTRGQNTCPYKFVTAMVYGSDEVASKTMMFVVFRAGSINIVQITKLNEVEPVFISSVYSQWMKVTPNSVFYLEQNVTDIKPVDEGGSSHFIESCPYRETYVSNGILPHDGDYVSAKNISI